MREESLNVNEIFSSIQGESTRAGMPCVFVRLSGCSLNCRWCDTRYASEESGTTMGLDEIVEKVNEMGPRYVTITGGEPLEQKATPELARRLLAAGFTVGVETNGAEDIGSLPDGVIRVMDVKCPSSRMDRRMNAANFAKLRGTDEVKFVLADRADYEFARHVIETRNFSDTCAVLLSPIVTELRPADLAEWILFDNLNVRLQLQLHRWIWPGQDRGV